MSDEQTIVVKRIVAGGHAGAWKIAYADFVTAMMAFFLMMWLIGSTTDGDKKGIADYFSSPLKVALFGGQGSGDASHVVKGGGEDITRSAGQVRKSDTEAERLRPNLRQLREEQARAESARLRQLQDEVETELRNNPRLAEFAAQIKLDMTRDGLRIQIVDAHSRPMFDSGSAVVKPYMRELLHAIGGVLAEVPNRLTLEGHTDAQPFSAGDRGYSNWELSADRANASRRELLAGALPEDRVLRVLGLAASVPFNRDDPLDPQNRRISIIVLNREAEERIARPEPAAEPPAATASEPSIRPEKPRVVSSQPSTRR